MSSKNNPLAYAEAEAYVQSIEKACVELAAVLNEETGHVRARRRAAIENLSLPKGEAVANYERSNKLLQRLRSENRLTPPLREKIRAAGTLVDKAIAANVIALRAAKDATERLMNMLQRSASETRPMGQGYNAGGDLHRGARRQAAPALTLNGTF